MATDTTSVHTSPDGTIRVEILAAEWRNSLWVNAPRVVETETGNVLLNLWGTNWDATVSWPEAGIARLDLRRFDLAGACAVLINPGAGCYTIIEQGARPEPLGTLEVAIENAFERSSKLATNPAAPVVFENQYVSIRDMIRRIMIGPAMSVGGIFLIVQSLRYGGDREQMPKVYDALGAAGTQIAGVIVGAALVAAGYFVFKAGLRLHKQFSANMKLQRALTGPI